MQIKKEILTGLGTDQLFCLLRDSCTDIVMKTLGLLRNLLSQKSDIDLIMVHHGEQVIQAVVMILESDHNVDIKEQVISALCFLVLVIIFILFLLLKIPKLAVLPLYKSL